MWYMFWFLVGFGFAIAGGVSIIGYMNFFPAGLTWGNYLIFISTRPECYLFPIGIVIIAISIYFFPSE
ncbi:MAG: hypothetical protein H0Z32_07415 [Bacillaceae bacterium]|nr:hypothetical protein [Bacillaceae bacterium]